MKYHNEDSLRGYYQCGECRQIYSVEVQDHKDDCIAKNGEALVFVFGKRLVHLAFTLAHVTGGESTITYGGLSVQLIKQHCPEALP